MNPSLARLQPYPFERLRALLAGAQPPARSAADRHVDRRTAPYTAAVRARRADASLHTLGSYPLTLGVLPLRQAVAAWLTRRFDLPPNSVNAETMILPVNGTREALFAVAQAVTDRSSDPLVVMPNPFYQIYEGAALLAGAEPWFMGNDRQQRVPARSRRRARRRLASLPAAVPVLARQSHRRCRERRLSAPRARTCRSVRLRRRSDECYSEIYLDEAQPPPGLLQAAIAAGHTQFERCLVFHSLSKRSSVPGLRSGFVAGDAALIKRSCCIARITAARCRCTRNSRAFPRGTTTSTWSRTARCIAQKFAQVLPILREVMEVDAPEASFYLWPRVDDDERFTRGLFETPARHDSARQLHRPRSSGGNPGPRPRAHLTGRERAGVRRGGATDSGVRQAPVMQ